MTELWCIVAYIPQARLDDPIKGTSWYGTRKAAKAKFDDWKTWRKDAVEMHLVRAKFAQRTKGELWVDALNNALSPEDTKTMLIWSRKTGKQVTV